MKNKLINNKMSNKKPDSYVKVETWLKNRNFDQTIIDKFYKEDIYWKLLSEIDENDLIDMNIDEKNREKLLKELEKYFRAINKNNFNKITLSIFTFLQKSKENSKQTITSTYEFSPNTKISELLKQVKEDFNINIEEQLYMYGAWMIIPEKNKKINHYFKDTDIIYKLEVFKK